MPFGESGYVRIRFQVEGQKEIVRRLATFGQQIETLAPAWEQVGQDLLDDFAANFAQEGGFFRKSANWPQLAPATVKDRLRRGYGGAHPMLERTGLLRQSVSERGTPGNVFLVEANSLTIGTSYPVAKWHQDGTRRKDGTQRMPARPVVGISWNRRSAIVKRLGDYVRTQLAANGLEG